MSIAYIDGDFTVATAVSPAVFSRPFPGVNEDLVLTQEFWQFRANREELDLNTEHPDYEDFLLVGEGPESDIGGGVVKWTRTYAKVPAQRLEATAMNFLYPGLIASGTSASRNQVRIDVDGVIVYDYFLTGEEGGSTVFSIPKIPRFQPYYVAYGSIFDAPIIYPASLPPNANYTSPTSQEYEQMITTYNNEFALGTVSIAHMIVARESIPRRWMGNIFERETIYVPPK